MYDDCEYTVCNATSLQYVAKVAALLGSEAMQLPLLLLLAACITAVTSTSETPDGSHERGATGPDGAEGDGETECLASEEVRLKFL